MHRQMSREAIAARRKHAREVILKNPDLTIDEVRQRVRCSQDMVKELRRELKREAAAKQAGGGRAEETSAV